ncbi:MAG: Bcr/CflA family drug resistance efflux transporter [Burkholderiales bacterium 35-55-47]|jgi:DHA1 family bicyclomycin/chloramphenicol resistance-like MFS transporter|uniref:multidrug effflux MFS transporter n=1 Tax=Limnohabitans sp. TaxID=1907725 RepID=UPI000BDCD4C8|nr:multidrug effflux MFS transporter [Limnohabitans sp.]OYY19922.1 MAG: Bcr/CflA family drug resistance efflux transporter [Burkholderiales bacterium 35-55-47]OYZ74467.1 MAG: Bcr/CflA family drug resistance efflux transporter [Burkholderiales bacterium 24-55-52]OZB01643.1 MAG: Bcr/CflA family drug resistance efflux transporter [Burkholderiales bacterium 39-55-53]HQR86138.1 multidrug effflux MFS transporter [Limnohabitans sp.]HQS25946.1 multidrug effflux MFS transporter [Limnohabitans sp.]
MSPTLIIVLLSMLLGIQPVATDLYLPALPTIKAEFGAELSQVQLTLSALLLAFGTSQLAWGPLSDRFGRRPILLCGLGLFTLAGLGCVLASSMQELIVWRALQGAAMGAVVMCARAIVRDLYTPETGAGVMSKALSGLGLLACASAPLGGLLTDLWSWHAALGLVMGFGAITLALVAWTFKETVHRKNPHTLQFQVLAKTWWHILRHPTFVAFISVSIGSYGGLFAFLASSSFVFINLLGLARWEYGLLLFSMAFTYLLGTMLCRRLLARWGVTHTVAIGGGFSLLGGCWMMLNAWLGWQSVIGLMGPFYLFVLAHGIHQPCGQSGAVGPFPKAAGAASALGGFLMMAAAFATGLWLGSAKDGSAMPMAQSIAFWSVLTALSAWLLVLRRGGPRV